MSKLILDGNAFYEIDEKCIEKKKEQKEKEQKDIKKINKQPSK